MDRSQLHRASNRVGDAVRRSFDVVRKAVSEPCQSGSDRSCGFWVDGADEYVSALQMEHNEQLDVLRQQQVAASPEEEQSRIDEAINHAIRLYNEELAEVPHLLF